MTRARSERLLRFAAILALAALALMVWSILDPRPVPVLVAMSLGQALGTGSLLLYVAVVVADLRRSAERDTREPPE